MSTHRRFFSTAIVRLKSLSAAHTTTHTFNSNGVLVGAVLASTLSSTPAAGVSAAFLRACATAETPLTPAADHMAPGEAADYLFDVTSRGNDFRIICFEGGAEPVFDGDLQGFNRLVARGFGQC
jgi:hypothetical protein